MGRIEEVRRRLNAELPRLMTEHEVPGASVAVLVDGQTIEAAAGVVNLRTGVEATPGALFMIQSITKVWTATLVMQLVDEGLVELDVPVRVYLPGFRTDDDRASAEVTVRHLLTHTGGFEGDLWAATTSGEDACNGLSKISLPAHRSTLAPESCFRTAAPATGCSAGWLRCCGSRRTPGPCATTWPARWGSRSSPSALTRRSGSVRRSATAGQARRRLSDR